ncbi:hypothetical protein F5X96DRAFT_691215 [Biscogniauxia mediterranea]|nr:hypothetical protein F5X96DRAFT_691215 [Biscogniauxia mediterranea]
MYTYSSSTPTSHPASQVETSPVAETAESPTTHCFQRLAIRIDMDENTYMASRAAQMRSSISGESNLPEVRHAATTPSSSAYGTPDIPATYSSVATFNYSVPPYDSALPTPVSVAGSPSLSERSSKMMHSYSPHAGASQQPTPPGTSRSWGYQVNVPCTSSATSMELQHSAGDMLNMHSLESSHSPDDHETMGNSAPPFHWGPYGVSSTEAPDEISPQIAHQSMFHGHLPNINPSELMRSSLAATSSSNMPLAPAPSQVPILPHSQDPRAYIPSVTPGDHLQHHYGGLSHHQPSIVVDFAHNPYSSRKASRSSRSGRSYRSTKRARGQTRGPQDGSMGSASTEGKSSRLSTQRITLKDDAPEDTKYLLDLRCQMDGNKGKGMWEDIVKAYEVRYGSKQGPNLQMTLARAVLRYAVWPSSEDEALKRAVEELDRRRYKDLLKLMKDYGGCEAWEWKECHLAKRLVELGYDEFDPQESTKKPRRQRRKAMRNQSSSTTWDPTITGLAYGNPQPVSEEQEEYLFHQYCKPDPDAAGRESVQNISEHEGVGVKRNTGDNQSARVAKQACQQILAGSNEQLYSSIPPSGGNHQHMS